MSASIIIPYDDGNLSLLEVQELLGKHPDTIIFSTYLDEDGAKMPVEYDELEEGLHDETRYGSLWLRNENIQVRLHPDEDPTNFL